MASLTLLACRAKGYKLDDGPGSTRSLRRTDAMVEGTRFVRSTAPGVGKVRCPRLVRAEELALDAALARAKTSKVAVISAASAYHPGGGFRTGGRHALEEAMCVQTTLALSLQRAVWLSRRPPEPIEPPERVKQQAGSRKWFCYIPDNGVVLSPWVEVFRGSYNTGYRFLPEAVELAAVVSVAMPNCNPGVRDSPLDAPADPEDYHTLLCTKFRAALAAASQVGASIVVTSAVGCGVFRNDPATIGEALGKAIKSLPASHRIQEVVLAGVPPQFLAAVEEQIQQSAQ